METPMPRLTPILVALALLVPALAFAQDRDGPPPKEDRAEIEQRIQMMRVFALTEALELDEATAVKLFPYLREGDASMRELHEKQRDAKRKLRKLVESADVDDATLDAIVGDIASIEIELTKARKTQFMGLKQILTPEQRGKFFVAQARFDREIRQRLREVRRERKGERRERRQRREQQLD
jgi:Spy/CpxP family protein refolding chaperone